MASWRSPRRASTTRGRAWSWHWQAAREAREPAVEAAALVALGRRAVLVAAPDAHEYCDVGVTAARRVDDPNLIADALLTQAGARERALDWERADALASEALELYRAVGDPYGAAWALAELGWYDLVHGRLDAAEQRLGEALELRRRHGDDRRLVEPLIDHAWISLARHDEQAWRRFVDCLGLARQVDDQFNVGEALAGLSAHAALAGRSEEAARLAGASAAVHERIGAPPWEGVTMMHEQALSVARKGLGADRFAAVFDEGHELSAEEALAARQTGASGAVATGAH